MSDFEYIQKPFSRTWTILDPGRSKRPNMAQGTNAICPFCPGMEREEIDRISATEEGGPLYEWLVMVTPNKYPFTSHHELIVHSPDHHKDLNELPISQGVRVLRMYQSRYKEHHHRGQVLLFHNRGEAAGESVPHPHTQLVVLPHRIKLPTPALRDLYVLPEGEKEIESEHFMVFSPRTSDWPEEVVIAPKKRKESFGEATQAELEDLAKQIQWVLKALEEKLGEDFPLNHYIYPLFDWYFRITPRLKTFGGFEVATNISVIGHDPKETMQFLRDRKASYS